MHVHVISAEGEAKYWLEPEIELARNYRYSNRQLREIEAHKDELTDAWREYFAG